MTDVTAAKERKGAAAKPPEVVAAPEAETTAAKEGKGQERKPARARALRPSQSRPVKRVRKQLSLHPVISWKLDHIAVDTGMEVGQLLEQWAKPHLSEHSYPPMPGWLRLSCRDGDEADDAAAA